MTEELLSKYGQKLDIIFPQNDCLKAAPTFQTVKDYYTTSGNYYTRFHSPEGALHLPISFSSKTPHKKKLQYQAECVSTSIKERACKSILELGCGMGFNTKLLAQKHPESHFTGIDITPRNIAEAQKNTSALNNTRFVCQNYQHLEEQDGSYDLIFAVESLCYATSLPSLIRKLHAKLNPGGRIVIFDAYINPEAQLGTESEQKAYKYLSWGFAMERFQHLEEIFAPEVLERYNIAFQQDLSLHILPNFLTFQAAAHKVLRFPRVLKQLVKLKLLSPIFIRQVAAGIFGPYFVQEKYLSYRHIVLDKKEKTTPHLD